MKFSIQREAVLQPLSQVIGVVERRQTLPVLANFLIVAGDGILSITGTDMEVELVSKISAGLNSQKSLCFGPLQEPYEQPWFGSNSTKVFWHECRVETLGFGISLITLFRSTLS